MRKERMDRRSFLFRAIAGSWIVISGFLGVVFGGYALSPSLRRSNSKWVTLGNITDFVPGRMTSKRISIEIKDAWARRKSRQIFYAKRGEQDAVTVFSTTCTHLGCNVAWDEPTKTFVCPCHGGAYDEDGRVIAGPPPRPLDKLETVIENGELKVRVG